MKRGQQKRNLPKKDVNGQMGGAPFEENVHLEHGRVVS
jgi:hypothetical protein